MAIASPTAKEGRSDAFFLVGCTASGKTAVAHAIARETGCGTACLHSCHNLSRAGFDAGETYLSLMRRNFDVLSALAG